MINSAVQFDRANSLTSQPSLHPNPAGARSIPAATALFGAYDLVAVVSLKTRQDRRAALDRDLSREGLTVEYFDALVTDAAGPFLKVGSHGAFLSHLQLLTSAGQAKKSILILQDDCLFLSHQTLAINPRRYDLFYGGWKAMDLGPVKQSRLVGAHCMGFSAIAACEAAKYLQAAYRKWRLGDHILPPIDGLLRNFYQSRPDLTVGFKKVATQRCSRSDISPSRFDSYPVARRLIAVARRLKSAWKQRSAII